MKKNFTLLISLIAIVFVFLFFFDQCHRTQAITTTTQMVYDDSIYIDTVIQKVKYDSIIYNDRWHNHTDTFIKHVDTLAIIKDYLAKVYGHHILKDDSMAFVAFDYLVSENRLQSISNIKYQNRSPTQIITKQYIDDKDRLYLGAELRLNLQQSDIGVYGIYEHRQWQYKAGYHILSKSALIGVGFRIR